MKRLITILTALFVIFVASFVHAQDIQDIPPGNDVIISVKKGQPAPIDGQVFDAATALRWANWLKQLRARLTLDVQKEKDVCKVEMTYRDTLLKVEQDRSAHVEKDLQDRLTRSEQARLKAEEVARSRPFWQSTEFGVIIGVAAAAGIFALSVWAVEATAQASP